MVSITEALVNINILLITESRVNMNMVLMTESLVKKCGLDN